MAKMEWKWQKHNLGENVNSKKKKKKASTQKQTAQSKQKIPELSFGKVKLPKSDYVGK